LEQATPARVGEMPVGEAIGLTQYRRRGHSLSKLDKNLYTIHLGNHRRIYVYLQKVFEPRASESFVGIPDAAGHLCNSRD
jgi:hypothetical protein